MKYFSNDRKGGLRNLRVASGSIWIFFEHSNFLRILPNAMIDGTQKTQIIQFYLKVIGSNWLLSGKKNQWWMINILRACNVSVGAVKRNAVLKLIFLTLEKYLIFWLKILRFYFRKLSPNCDCFSSL